MITLSILSEFSYVNAFTIFGDEHNKCVKEKNYVIYSIYYYDIDS